MTIGKSSAFGIIRNINSQTNRIQKNLTRLSSGLRINSASDDAAGLAISEGLAASARIGSQAIRNAEDGQSLVRIAEQSLSTQSDIITRLRELATQASNDTLTDTQRSSLAVEYDQLKEELGRTQATSDFNGINPLNGDSISVQVGDGSSPDDAIQVNGVSTPVNEVNATSISSREGALSALGQLESALNSVSSARADLGSFESRLEVTKSNLAVKRENELSARSRITDADIAEEAADLLKNQILQEGGVRALRSHNLSLDNVRKLLG